MSPAPASPGGRPDPRTAVLGAERVTAVFGRWPSFHDAEVRALDVTDDPGGFAVTIALHAFAVTSAVDERGNYRLDRHTLVTLRFSACTDLQLDSLDRHTTLHALHLTAGPPWMVVFENASGPDGSLRCHRIEVLEAAPWRPPPAT